MYYCYQFVILLCLISVITGYPSYQDQIPNGKNVPHPCKKNYIWKGVGHLQMNGGGKRNVFGEAFSKAQHKWTKQLCEADSDKDGKSNGEELGDPNCVWTAGSKPTSTVGISHPGICEPVDSEHCRSQQSYECGGEYNCEATNQTGVKYIDLKFPRTKVPPNETTFMCNTFTVPADKRYHAIAFEPLADNANVIHHMSVFACTEAEASQTKKTPHVCNMSKCRSNYITVWTVGLEGYCLKNDVGLLFGNGSFTHFSIELHWNNPKKRTDYYDGSGMRMFYTDKLRPYSEGVMFFGQQYIKLEPNTPETMVEGTCNKKCSKKTFLNRVNITSVLLHMHYLGVKARAEQYRDGKLIRVLAKDEPYFYESPDLHIFDPPVEFIPGDEIKTTCYFDTKKDFRQRSKTVWWGQGTQDEMCYVIITYYPRMKGSGFHFCINTADIDPCDPQGSFGCNATEIYMIGQEAGQEAKNNKCDLGTKECTSSCMGTTEGLREHKCMQGKVGELWRHFMKDQSVYKMAELCYDVLSGQDSVTFSLTTIITAFVLSILTS